MPTVFATLNANASIHGVVGRRVRQNIPGLIAPTRESKYPFALVQEIRQKYWHGGYMAKDLAQAYGISRHLISNWCQYLQRVHS